MRKHMMLSLIAICLGTVGVTKEAKADFLELNLNVLINGVDPGGFLRATFQDVSTSGTVRLTMDTTNLLSGRFVDSWAFNLNEPLSAASLTFTRVGATLPIVDSVIQSETDGGNNLKAGLFDFGFNFATNSANGGANRFNSGQTVVYDIMGQNLTAGAFNAVSSPEQINPNNIIPGGYFSAAHVQGIPGTPQTLSGSLGAVTAVPEPSSLGVVALIGCMCLSNRRQRKPRAFHSVRS